MIDISEKKIRQILAIVLAAMAFLLAFCINELNLKHLRKDGFELRKGQTVVTNDDISYLKPFETYYHTGQLYTSELEKFSSMVRSPGYGLFYFIHLKTFGPEQALHFQKIVQLILFALSVYCLFFIAYFLSKKTWLALVTSATYGLLPFSMGFLYYTLTEALTPAFVIFYSFFLLKALHSDTNQKKLLHYAFAALMLAYLILLRPFLMGLGLAFPFFLFRDFQKNTHTAKLILYFIMLGSISISGLTIWQIRNFRNSGEILSLHPIYQNQLPGMFRKPHKAVWNFVKGWEHRGAIFHQMMSVLWDDALNGDSCHSAVNNVLALFPFHVTAHFGKERLSNSLKLYQKSVKAQSDYYLNNTLMPASLLPEEAEAIAAFEALEAEYRKVFFIKYHLKTPFSVFKNMSMHSNLSLYIFQHTYRGNRGMELLRWICFMIYFAVFLLCFGFVFAKQPYPIKILLGLTPLLYIFYLCYFQRGIEERYTLPMLPLLITNAFLVSTSIFVRVKKIITSAN